VGSVEQSICPFIAAKFESAGQLASAVIETIVSADGRALPTCRLLIICQALGFHDVTARDRARYNRFMQSKAEIFSSPASHADPQEIVRSLESLSKGLLVAVASSHAIDQASKRNKDELRVLIIDHITKGLCTSQTINQTTSRGCLRVVEQYGDSSTSNVDLQIILLTLLVKNIRLKPLKHLLEWHKVIFSPEDGLAKLRRVLKKYITTIKKGKVTT
jgi:hypothetical protein